MLRADGWWRRLWGSSGTLYLWIGEQGVDLGCLTGGGKRARWQRVLEVPFPDPEADVDDVQRVRVTLEELSSRKELAAFQHFDLRVIVADRWVAMASMPWSDVLLDPLEARGFAREYLRQLGFDVKGGDVVRLDRAPYAQSRWVVAYPEALLHGIATCAERMDLRCRNVRPLAVVAWRYFLRASKARGFAVMGNAAATLALWAPCGFWGRPCVQEINMAALPDNASLDDLRLAWHRWGLRQPAVSDVGEVLVLDATSDGCSAAPATGKFKAVSETWRELRENAGWLSGFSPDDGLDVVAMPARSGFALRLLVCGMLVAAICSILEGGLRYQQYRQLGETYDREARATHVSAAKPVSWTKEEQKQVRAVNMAVRQLNMPVQAVMEALRPPEAIRVAVLSIETEVAQGEQSANRLKITAESPSSADMTRYVAFVAGRRPFTQVYLMRHDMTEGSEKRFRFSVEAQWED